MRHNIFCALVMLIVGAALAVAQNRLPQADASIRGKVLLSNGQAGEHIEVRLEGQQMQVIASTFTDGIGNFEFRNLPIGAYNIAVRAEGYEEVRQLVEMTAIRAGASTTIILNKSAAGDNRT